MWFSVACTCTLIDNDMGHHSGQNVVGQQTSPQQILTTLMTFEFVVTKTTDPAKPHFGLFFTTISTSKKFFFFSAQAEKGIG